jgi:hypothetical protein
VITRGLPATALPPSDGSSGGMTVGALLIFIRELISGNTRYAHAWGAMMHTRSAEGVL